MDETAQEKLDRLDAANRARVKKFKAKAIAKGFKQITALVDAMTYEELCKRRDRAFQAGEQISIAEVIKRALFGEAIAPEGPAPEPKAIDRDQDQDPRQLLLFLDPVDAPMIEAEQAFTLEAPAEEQMNDPASTADLVLDGIDQGALPDWNNKQEYRVYLRKIIPGIINPLGPKNWQAKADLINSMGIKSTTGKEWSQDNVRQFK